MSKHTIYLPADAPQAWLDLFEGLALLVKGHKKEIYPFHCEHDVLLIQADPSAFTEEELDKLERLGFVAGSEYDENEFMSYRYGSA